MTKRAGDRLSTADGDGQEAEWMPGGQLWVQGFIVLAQSPELHESAAGFRGRIRGRAHFYLGIVPKENRLPSQP